MRLHLSRQLFVIGCGSDHRDILKVLGSRTKHRGAAYVDVLHQLSKGRAGLTCGFFEGIQIYHHHVDGFDTLLCHRRPVFNAVANMKNAPVYLGVQGFHPAIEHFRETGEVGNIAHFESDITQDPRCASGRNQLHVHTAQLAGEIYQASLIGNA